MFFLDGCQHLKVSQVLQVVANSKECFDVIGGEGLIITSEFNYSCDD